MACIELSHVSVELPVFSAQKRSLRRAIMGLGTGLNSDSRIAEGTSDICVRALVDVTLNFDHGDRIGVIGANGAGKTTLLRVLSRIYEPPRGTVQIDGRITSLLDLSIGIHPENTGYETILLRGLHLGQSARTMREHMDEIVDFAELGGFIGMPVRTYSAGMYFRLAFAAATCIEPEILLMDEWISAGDAHFVQKVEARLNRFLSRSSIVVLASHDLDLIARICSKVVVLQEGRAVFFGPVKEATERYAHLCEQ